DEHDRAVPEPAQPGDEVVQMLFGEVRARRREIERGHAGDEKREDGQLDRSAAIHRDATATTELESIVTASPLTLSTVSRAALHGTSWKRNVPPPVTPGSMTRLRMPHCF